MPTDYKTSRRSEREDVIAETSGIATFHAAASVTRNACGTVAVTLGGGSLFPGISVFGGILVAPIGLDTFAFGATGLRLAYEGERPNRGQAKASLVLGVISVALFRRPVPNRGLSQRPRRRVDVSGL
jgi:hypothetical protein